MHHPKADVDRLYIPRQKRGRGLIQLELSYKTSTIGLDKYLKKTNDWMLKLVSQHENSKKSHSITKESKIYPEIKFVLDCDLPTPNKNTYKAREMSKIKGLKQSKPLHGQYAARLQNTEVDVEATLQWLSSSELKAETEGFIFAAQDQSLFTRNYQANIIRNETDPKCRFCGERVETIDHLIPGCSVLTPGEYKRRHDGVGQYLHWKICNHFKVSTKINWYEHHSEPITDGPNFMILWDFPIQTDRTIQANGPDVVVKNFLNNVCYLIDMSVPSDKNVSFKTFEKLSKYKDLKIENGKMWHLRARTIPVVIGALGLVKKGTEDFLDKIPGNPSLREIQKIVLSGTAHVIRKALSI